jgi:hypothetical protein
MSASSVYIGFIATIGLAGVLENKIMANPSQQLEPRWPALLALLAVGRLRLALPESLSAGPDWLRRSPGNGSAAALRTAVPTAPKVQPRSPAA